MQRMNYGIPPRQSQMAPNPVPAPSQTPSYAEVVPVQTAPQQAPVAPTQQVAQQPQQAAGRFMEFAGPVGPAPNQMRPSVAPTPVPSQTQAPTGAPYTPVAPKPLFTPTAAPAPKSQSRRHLPKVRWALVVVGTLLLIAGLGRWVTAGSTAHDAIAVGAVSANDGNSMTIQFTADDGKMHKFTGKSSASLIPGSAVEVAYRSGAPEASARRVSVVQQAHNLGVAIAAAGVALLIVAGLWFFANFLKNGSSRRSPAAPITVPAATA